MDPVAISAQPRSSMRSTLGVFFYKVTEQKEYYQVWTSLPSTKSQLLFLLLLLLHDKVPIWSLRWLNIEWKEGRVRPREKLSRQQSGVSVLPAIYTSWLNIKIENHNNSAAGGLNVCLDKQKLLKAARGNDDHSWTAITKVTAAQAAVNIPRLQPDCHQLEWVPWILYFLFMFLWL